MIRLKDIRLLKFMSAKVERGTDMKSGLQKLDFCETRDCGRTTKSILKLNNISKSYKDKVVLHNISIEILAGEMVGIMGRSGAGKTTLLNIFGFLDFADSGIYEFDSRIIDIKNENLKAKIRRDSIGFVIQNYALINQKSVFYNIAVPLICKNKPKEEIKKCVEEMAKQVGVFSLLNKYPYELSGGECQRVSIARALVRKPKVILADEPTGALDKETESDILDIFKSLNEQGITILIVTHNEKVSNCCNKVYKIIDGEIS